MPYHAVFVTIVKIDTIRLNTTDKVGTINVLTFHAKPAIINKSPRGEDAESKTAGGSIGGVGTERRAKKRSQKISEKVLTKEMRCDIILKLSRREARGKEKNSERNLEKPLDNSERK